ncbi:cytochrome b5-like Heme/Steroid binding domain-containing protein [Colletotrichum orchidophilum]|uniref:Cytochrome b5-like Heme/Steroid binding domain-containing protein n=1 Tax=Colletotrichum orchidophilum TaxID=1209926 RepID=A0A1G4BN95_9PEZI|nr:cytochrome b5-like Heme/Steroid binding domain-containing protein [Colletotrichum orchidophilum]OHF02929.1 cytochrome b5-like Heme/Steroid binding domain-containing protein [Colletotrichum orchidophilum]
MSGSSPARWEKQYGVGKTHPPRRNGLSWMDPVLPSIDPQTLQMDEPYPEEILEPLPSELDDLYLSERQQLAKLSGLRTWEAALLAKTETYTTPGEGQTLIGKELEVIESSWLPIWSRDRWMIDFTVPPNWSNDWSRSQLWSAHDPLIWGVLRKAIQIADNIMRNSLEGDWLQSLLIPENIESYDTIVPSCSGPITIFINIVGMKTLLDADTTQSSKSAALMNLASTHMIGFVHLGNGALRQSLGHPIHNFEIFGPGEHHFELGWSFEQHAFGGTLCGLVPRSSTNDFHTMTYAPLILSIRKFPHIFELKETYGIVLNSPTIDTRWPMPSLWHDSFSSEAFWTQIVSKYGYQSLMGPKMLVSATQHGNQGFFEPWFHPRETSARFIEEFIPQTFHADSLKMLARSLLSRRLKYHRMRPWLQDTYAMWQMTPYGLHNPREDLARLADVPPARRNDRYEDNAEWFACNWIHPLRVTRDQNDLLVYEASPTQYGAHIVDGNRTQWFWRAIGFLLVASLPGRLATITPIKQPKRSLLNPWTIPQSLSLNESQRDEVQKQIERAESRRWTYPPIHLPERHINPGDPSATRSIRHNCIDLAVTAFDTYLALCIEPAGLRDAFETECNSLRAQLNADHGNDFNSWLDFRFQMPQYPGHTSDGRTYSLWEFWQAGVSTWKSPDKDLGDRAAEVFHGEDPAKYPSRDLPAFAQSGIVGSPLRPGQSYRRHQVPYYTVAELYDHAQELEEALVLVENGYYLDVYRCSAVCRSLEIEQNELLSFTRSTFYGRQLTCDAAEWLSNADLPSLAIGRVVRVIRDDDIAECDGKDGRPLWIRLHNSVFDVTYLKSVSEPRLRGLLASSPAGNPSLRLLEDGYTLAEVKRSLAPWRVGIVAKTPGAIADKHSVRTFTAQSLRKHEFRETGMYISIDNKVYNISGEFKGRQGKQKREVTADRSKDYAETHPGGLHALVENGGRDITDLFNQYHQENRSRILAGLKELFGREVYSVKALKESSEYAKLSKLVDDLSPYLGADATQALKAEEGNDGPLLRFSRLRGYIVASIDHGLPEIEPIELSKFDGHADEIHDVRYDAFVASDGMVYDLTAIMLYGSSNPNYAKFETFLGGVVTDEEMKTYLQTHCQGLVCAILVQKRRREQGRRTINWNPKKKAPLRYKMPIWANRTKKSWESPLEDQVAPHMSTLQKAKKRSKEEDFEKKDVFEPTPSRSYLQNLVCDLGQVVQPSLAQESERRSPRSGDAWPAELNESAAATRARSPTPEQLSRLNSELRRHNDEKVVRNRARACPELKALGKSRGTAVPYKDNSSKHETGTVIKEEVYEEGEFDPRQAAAQPGMSRKELLVTKKRKPVFKIDDGAPRKRR